MTAHETPRVSVWLLGEFRIRIRRDDGTDEVVKKSVWAGSYARPLLKRLLPATGRRASRSTLIDDLWPVNDPDDDSEEEENHEKRADKYLRDAATKLRQLFGKEIINLVAGVFELAGPSFLWSDIGECDRLMREAERPGPSSADAILLLEKVSTYYKRGGMLEGESGEWCLGFRAQQEEAMRYCHNMLAKGYEAQKKLWLAREQYQRLFEINPLDEEALCCLLAMQHRHGLIDSLRSSYKEAQKRFEKDQMSLSKTTIKLFEHLMQSPPSFDAYLTPPREVPRPLESETAQQPDPSLALTVPMAYNESRQSSSLPRLEMPELLMMQRRKFLYDLLNTAGSSVIFSPYGILPQESREHLELMMMHPSYVDDEAIGALAATIQNFWNLRQKIAPINMLGMVAEHLTTVTQLLRESRLTPIYENLCALACENAQLLGRTFHEIREYDLAWNSYAFSLNMAQKIHHTDLWASGVARLAELLISWGEPQEALPFLEEAQKRSVHDPRLCVWLSVLEAQIHAMAGKTDKYLRALERSKKITLPECLAHDPYRTGFNPLALAGYEGACLMWLHQSERALPLLNEAFTTCDPTSILLRSLRLANLGRVYGQLGDAKKACELLLESLGITAQTKSLNALQRIYQGRGELDPWKDSADVKELDAQIVEVYRNLAGVRERV